MITINYKELSNKEKWEQVKHGTFVIVANSPHLQGGLYRIFRGQDVASGEIFLFPLFDGNFELGAIPHIILTSEDSEFPPLERIVSSVTIDINI